MIFKPKWTKSSREEEKFGHSEGVCICPQKAPKRKMSRKTSFIGRGNLVRTSLLFQPFGFVQVTTNFLWVLSGENFEARPPHSPVDIISVVYQTGAGSVLSMWKLNFPENFPRSFKLLATYALQVDQKWGDLRAILRSSYFFSNSFISFLLPRQEAIQVWRSGRNVHGRPIILRSNIFIPHTGVRGVPGWKNSTKLQREEEPSCPSVDWGKESLKWTQVQLGKSYWDFRRFYIHPCRGGPAL